MKKIFPFLILGCIPEPDAVVSSTDISTSFPSSSSSSTSSSSFIPTSSTSITDSICGNNEIEFNEECDDGNQNDNDACLTNCKKAICGDQALFEGLEICDDGPNDTPLCDADCTLPLCGDKHVNASTGEECDGEEGCSGNCLWTGTLVFVTSVTYEPNIGTLNADANCQKLAKTAGLNGIFRAWLWTTVGGPGVNWPILNPPYTLPNGDIVAFTWDQFYLGRWNIPINITENGIPYVDENNDGKFSNAAWVGYHAEGIQSWPEDENCVDWSTSSALGGAQDLKNLQWNGLGQAWGLACINFNHFICVEVPEGNV